MERAPQTCPSHHTREKWIPPPAHSQCSYPKPKPGSHPSLLGHPATTHPVLSTSPGLLWSLPNISPCRQLLSCTRCICRAAFRGRSNSTELKAEWSEVNVSLLPAEGVERVRLLLRLVPRPCLLTGDVPRRPGVPPFLPFWVWILHFTWGETAAGLIIVH